MAQSPKKNVQMPFPVNGVFEARPHDQQPERTTTDAKNVIAFDVSEDKQRGGRRPGIKKTTPDTSDSGNRFDGKVQLLDTATVSGTAAGAFKSGAETYDNSSTDDPFIPPGTPANLTTLAKNPDQDPDTEDAIGTENPELVSVSSNHPIPLPMFEVTTLIPKPTAANWGDNEFPEGTDASTDPFNPTQESFIPSGSNVGTTNLWHVKTVYGKDGCFYPKAPFDLVGDGNNAWDVHGDNPPAETLKAQTFPHRFIEDMKDGDNLPYNMFGGGEGDNPTTGTVVSSVLFPYQHENENAFQSGDGKTWSMSANIRTCNRDVIDSYFDYVGAVQNWVPVTYYQPYSGGHSGQNRTFMFGHNWAASARYLYGFVFRVKADAKFNDSTITATAEEQLLFVGFHQDKLDNLTGARYPTKKPEVVIGSIKNTSSDDVELQNKRTLKLPGNDTAEVEPATWYELEVRCDGTNIQVFLDSTMLEDTGNSAVSKFEITDFITGGYDNSDIDNMRARSGLLFWRQRNCKPRHLAFRPTPNHGTMHSLIGFAAVNHVTTSTIMTLPWTGGVGSTAVCWYYGQNNNVQNHVTAQSWSGYSNHPYMQHEIVINRRLGMSPVLGDVFTIAGTANTTNVGIYSQKASEFYSGLSWDYTTTGSYSNAYNDGNNTKENGYFWETSSINQLTANAGNMSVVKPETLMFHSDHGGSWVRDWNEPFFHDVQWSVVSVSGEPDRVVVGVGNGEVKVSSNGADSFTAINQLTDDDGNDRSVVFNPETRVAGVEFYSNYYMADGTKYGVLNTTTRELQDWSRLTAADSDADDNETPGNYSIPGGPNFDTDTLKCNLIAQHMGRLVLAGLPTFPNNWFMSQIYTDEIGYGQGPNNWDVGSDSGDSGTGPVAGTSSSLAEIGEPIKAMFNFREDSLVFGCRDSIYVLTGDPGMPESGSSMVSISRDIGIVGPDAWAYGPNRSLYFFGSNGLYSLSPNEFNVNQANRISVGKLDREFASVDLSKFNIRLVYDYFLYGLHVFMSANTQPSNETGGIRHYFYDLRSEALWPMEYPSIHGPSASIYYSNADPERRRVLLGGFDGHVRHFNRFAKNDDGTPIDDYVWIGPFLLDPITETKITRIASVLDKASSVVGWSIHAGDTVEDAKGSDPIASGSWNAGRNLWKYTRVRGQSVFIKLYTDEPADGLVPWSLESITATLAVAGSVRERN